MKNKIIEAIQKINPTAEVSVSAEDINSIVWDY
jgi:copper chaperone CopZ